MNVGWIWTVNLRPFMELVSSDLAYAFGDADWTAIEHGLVGTDSEQSPWFDYPVGGAATVSVAFEPGADEMVSIRLDGDLTTIGPRIEWLANLLRDYEMQPRGGEVRG